MVFVSIDAAVLLTVVEVPKFTVESLTVCGDGNSDES